MSSSGSVTQWLHRLKAGDREAFQKLWERYFRRLVGLARKRLLDLRRGASDEEDVALSAFDSFWQRAGRGRFPRLDDRHDLWQVLVIITCRKAHDLIEYEGRDKRDWRRTVHGADPPGADSDQAEPLLCRLVGREPEPGFAAEVAEQYRHALGKLEDDELRAIAQRKLEGYTNDEIAAEREVARATVERRLRLIRKRWSEEGIAEGVARRRPSGPRP
jgi:RNA polymerase sigma factor (sigma-70 family)